MKRLALALLFLLLATAPAAALMENDFAIMPQAGGVLLGGELGEMFAPDFAFGGAFAFGIADWVGLEADVIYSVHQAADEDQTGRIDLSHCTALAGPRFNWNTQYVVPYATLLGGASFLGYKAKWVVKDATLSDDNNAHGFGGALGAGVDFFVANSFTVGLSGRVGYFSSNLEYKNADEDDGEAGGYAFYAGLLRFTLLF